MFRGFKRTDEGQVLTTRETLSRGREPAGAERVGNERKKSKCLICWEEIVLKDMSVRLAKLDV